MSTVIYLANQQIQVITGTPGNRKISVADCYTEDAPDGCLINGMIMDADHILPDATYYVPLKTQLHVVSYDHIPPPAQQSDLHLK